MTSSVQLLSSQVWISAPDTTVELCHAKGSDYHRRVPAQNAQSNSEDPYLGDGGLLVGSDTHVTGQPATARAGAVEVHGAGRSRSARTGRARKHYLRQHSRRGFPSRPRICDWRRRLHLLHKAPEPFTKRLHWAVICRAAVAAHVNTDCYSWWLSKFGVKGIGKSVTQEHKWRSLVVPGRW